MPGYEELTPDQILLLAKMALVAVITKDKQESFSALA